MKKILVVLFLTLSSSFFTLCSGQISKYYPFPDSNAVWVEDIWAITIYCSPRGEQSYNYFSYYANGDTIVNSKTYTKIRISGGYNETPECSFFNWLDYDTLACLLRDDTTAKKVYVSYKPHLGIDSILYDFTLHVGDYLPPFCGWYRFVSFSDSNFVYAIDSTLIGGKYRKQFIIAGYKSAPIINDTIIEGIGSSMGLLEQIYFSQEGGSNLNCFSDSSNVLYSPGNDISCKRFVLALPSVKNQKPSISVYPNPSGGQFTLSCHSEGNEESTSTIEVYNELGQQVYSNTFLISNSTFQINLSAQANGVYLYRITATDGTLIRNGKLVIER